MLFGVHIKGTRKSLDRASSKKYLSIKDTLSSIFVELNIADEKTKLQITYLFPESSLRITVIENDSEN